MGNVSKQTASNPPTDRQPMCDDDILRLLADNRARTVAETTAHFRVTETAIRRRLIRLTASQSITRQRSDGATGKPGRPTYLYHITSQGTARLAGAKNEGNA
jgi:predicted ArsR family transcriptional regulator